MRHRTRQAKRPCRTHAVERLIATGRLTQPSGIGHHVTDVISDLVRLTEPIAQCTPAGRVVAGCLSASRGCRGKQSASLGTLIRRKIGLGLAFPCLSGDDAVGRPDAGSHRFAQANQAFRMRAADSCESAKRQHNQRIPGEYRQALAERSMNRGLPAAHGRIVKTGKIVVHQGGAVHQFDRHGGRIGHGRGIVTARPRHCQAQLRTDARTTREHRVACRCHQSGRGCRRLAKPKRSV